MNPTAVGVLSAQVTSGLQAFDYYALEVGRRAPPSMPSNLNHQAQELNKLRFSPRPPRNNSNDGTRDIN
eukprot:4474496-Amphidinium_carterae.1